MTTVIHPFDQALADLLGAAELGQSLAPFVERLREAALALPPPPPRQSERQPLASATLEELWDAREEARIRRNEWSATAGAIDQELERRIREARPDWDPESGGTAALVGDRIEIIARYDREYAYDEAQLLGLQAEKLVTLEEFGKLVKYEARVNGTVFNALLKRGGRVAELLTQARILRRATPKFEARERAV
jgi:hypothetical protein